MKICPSTPSSLGLIVHESFILPSKEEGIMSRKKQQKNVNEDTIGNEIVTSDQLTNKCNTMQIFLCRTWMY
jgi:hypothetical protein